MSQIKTMNDFFKRYLPSLATYYYISIYGIVYERKGCYLKVIGHTTNWICDWYPYRGWFHESNLRDEETLREISINQMKAVLNLTKRRD
jgi:hypothetical protein